VTRSDLLVELNFNASKKVAASVVAVTFHAGKSTHALHATSFIRRYLYDEESN
jgi:uncharacterized UBP type Zn finger protein